GPRIRFRHDTCVFRIVASRELRAAVAAYFRRTLEADLAERTSVGPGVGFLRDLEPDQARALLAEGREVLVEERFDASDVEAFRPPRFDLVGIFLAQQVVAGHAAEGLQDLVPDVFRHPLEVFVRREIHEVARDLLESRLDRGRVEFEAERGAARRATGRVREPGRPAHRTPGPALRMLRPRDEIREEDLPSDRAMEALPDCD